MMGSHLRPRRQSNGFASFARTGPQKERFEGTFILLFILLFTFFIGTHFRKASLRQLEGQTASRTSHEPGHAIHTSSLSQGRILECLICIPIVSTALYHGTLKLLLQASWDGESTDHWCTLNDELDSHSEELVAAVARRRLTRRPHHGAALQALAIGCERR